MLNLPSSKKTIPILVFILLICAVAALFSVKYNVRQDSKRLNHIEKEIKCTMENIHVLKAELTYLTRPEYIKELADKYLDLTQVSKSNVIDLNELDEK